MRWRKWSFSLFAAMLLGTSLTAEADTQESVSAYEHRMALRVERWNRLIPRMTMLQYAGGMGTVSAGPGWGYARDHCLETHVLLGFIPKRYNRHAYWTLTARELWMPWRLHPEIELRGTPADSVA